MEVGVELDPHYGRQWGEGQEEGQEEEDLGEVWERAAEFNVGDPKAGDRSNNYYN